MSSIPILQVTFHSKFISGILLYFELQGSLSSRIALHVTHILIYRQMVLYMSTGYWVLSIVYLDQLKGARHTHISYHNS